MDQCLPEIAKSMAEIIQRSTNSHFKLAALSKLGIGSVEEVPQRLLELMQDVAEKKKEKKKRKNVVDGESVEDNLLWEE
jgi:hypothetical protein